MHRSRLRYIAAGALLVVPGGWIQAQEPPGSFSEQLDVTAVEVMIDVHDGKGNPVLGLTADDFLVWEDGEPVEVLGVDYPAPSRAPWPPAQPEARPLPGQPAALARTADWRFLVYVDGPLSGQRSVRRAMEILEGRADELVARGPVEVVVANPEPRLVQAFTRDPERLREALREVAGEPAGNELRAMRRSFMTHLDHRLTEGEGPSAATEINAILGPIRSFVRREFHLVERRLHTLSEWMSTYGDVPASAVILVSDGFDLAPSEFYLGSISLPTVETQLRAELQEYRVDSMADQVARQLAATGWTSLLLSMGSGGAPPVAADASMAQRDRFRSIGELTSAGPESASINTMVEHPLEPLNMVAEQTGGQLVTNRRRAGEAIDRLGQRLRLTYVAPRARDGRVHDVRVEATRPGLELLAPQWVRSPTAEQVAASRARRLLVMDSDAGELPVEIEFPVVGPRKSGGSRVASALVSVDLNLLRSVLQEARVPISLTFGVEIPGSAPFVHRVLQELDLPAAEGEALPRLSYQTVIEVPVSTRRVSIVVEETQSGIWGGAVGYLAP